MSDDRFEQEDVQRIMKEDIETLKNEEVTISISVDTINMWKSNDDEKYSKLTEEIEKSEPVIAFINRYQVDRWQVHSIDAVNIYETENNEGELDLEFTKHQYNGCPDHRGEDPDDMAVSFVIDYDLCKLSLTGDPIRVRTTFEEF